MKHGSIRQRSSEVGEVGDAPAEERYVAVRQSRKRRPCEKPEASDRDWAIGGAEERSEGPTEENGLSGRSISPEGVFPLRMGTKEFRPIP